MASNGSQITVTFLHPRDSQEFKAAVAPRTTGTQAIEGMVKENFIEPPGAAKAYVLQSQRTGKTIPLSASLISSGIQDGDVVAVSETSAGAGR